MAYPGDTSMVSESALRAEGGDAELADLGRQGPNDFFNGLLDLSPGFRPLPVASLGRTGSGFARRPTDIHGDGTVGRRATRTAR